MPNKSSTTDKAKRKVVKKLDKIIEICTRWKKHIIEKTSVGEELLLEFEEEDIIDILSDLF